MKNLIAVTQITSEYIAKMQGLYGMSLKTSYSLRLAGLSYPIVLSPEGKRRPGTLLRFSVKTSKTNYGNESFCRKLTYSGLVSVKSVLGGVVMTHSWLDSAEDCFVQSVKVDQSWYSFDAPHECSWHVASLSDLTLLSVCPSTETGN